MPLPPQLKRAMKLARYLHSSAGTSSVQKTNRKSPFSIFEVPLHLKRSPHDELNLLTGHFLFVCNPSKIPKGTAPPREHLYHNHSLKSTKIFPDSRSVFCTAITRLPFKMGYLPPSEQAAEISMTLSEDRHPVTDGQKRVHMHICRPTGLVIKGFFAAQFYRNNTLDLIHHHHYWQWFIFHTEYRHLVPYTIPSRPIGGQFLANIL